MTRRIGYEVALELISLLLGNPWLEDSIHGMKGKVWSLAVNIYKRQKTRILCLRRIQTTQDLGDWT